MKIKMNKAILGVDGITPIPDGSSEGKLTLKNVCIGSILTPLEKDDEKIKFSKWEIFKKLRDSKDEVELTIEEIALIKSVIGKLQPPLILGQCYEMIEG